MSGKESATRTEQTRQVREMFEGIASRYDLLNHLLSGNIDRLWRRRVAKRVYAGLLATRTPQILDVACGTGDLALTLFERGDARIIGIDFCHPMLKIANAKASRKSISIPFIEGDALQLPFPDCSFEAVTVAFGLRNFSSVDDGIKELLRVVKPGGKLFVLEFSRPVVPVLRSIYELYFRKLLPILGGFISGSRGAYEYLPDSVSRFPDQKELARLMTRAGFSEVTFENLTGGIAALHSGTRIAG